MINQHVGNKVFCSVVDKYRSDFLATSKRREKRDISQSVVDEVHRLGGRFLLEVKSARGEGGSGNARGSKGKEKMDGVDPRLVAKVWILVDNEKVSSCVLFMIAWA